MKAYTGEPVILKISGSFNGDTALASSDLILVTESAFRRIFGVPAGRFTDLVVTIRNLTECPTIAEKVTTLLPDTRPVLREEIRRTYASIFDWRSGYIIILLGGAVLAFFIFAWDKATGLSAQEKAEIGILKALGWDTCLSGMVQTRYSVLFPTVSCLLSSYIDDVCCETVENFFFAA